MTFTRFIGIDWSGDRRPFQKGIKVAEALPGSTAPALIAGPGPKERWSRTDVMALILGSVQMERCLIGLDFAFGFPANHGSFDWSYVDACCCDDRNFYGGRFFSDASLAHADLVNSLGRKGARYNPRAYRNTEIAASAIRGATPQTVFNAVGAAQVGPSSISGMRMLRALVSQASEYLVVWPFEPVTDNRSVIVEIFPRLFPLIHGLPPAMCDHGNLNRALSAFQSEPTPLAPRTEDEGDALVSAAALRHLSASADQFIVPLDLPANEGWIFGVR